MSEVSNDLRTEPGEAARTKELDLDAYASLASRLAQNPATRDALLAAHGLDEARWAEIDDAWQAKLEAAMNADVDGVHPLIEAYSAAFTRAHRAPTILAFERFVEATRVFQRGGDPTQALARLGVTLPQFLEAHGHWTRTMARDDALARRFRDALEKPESERAK